MNDSTPLGWAGGEVYFPGIYAAMNLISFDPFRTLGIACTTWLKPEELFRHAERIRAADYVLFPQSWQLNVLAYAWKLRTFPSYPSYDIGYDKVEMTRAFQALAPAHCPQTLILPANAEGAAQALETLGLPFVVKHPRSSMGRGVELIEGAADLYAWIPRTEVLYAQEYLPATADLRVVWIGDQVVTAYWRRGGDGFHHNLSRGAVPDFDDVPPAALDLVARVATALGIDHAGFDIAVIEGWPFLIELNCLFGHEGLSARGIRLAPFISDHLRRSVLAGHGSSASLGITP